MERHPKHLKITLNGRSLAARSAGKSFDIGRAIEKIPTARVIGGDPTLSVHVEVAVEYERKVADAVRGYCNVSDYHLYEVF